METQIILLEKWIKRCRESQKGHYEASKLFSLVNYSINIPPIIITAFLGTYSSLDEISLQLSSMHIAIGLILSSVLIALQTFLKLGERSVKHKLSGTRYGSIRREIEILLTLNKISNNQIENLSKKIDNVSAESPNIPKNVWNKVEKIN